MQGFGGRSQPRAHFSGLGMTARAKCSGLHEPRQAQERGLVDTRATEHPPGEHCVARTWLPWEIVKGSSMLPADGSGQGSVSASAGTVPALRAAGHCEFRPTALPAE